MSAQPTMSLMAAGALGAATAAAREHGLLHALAQGPATPETLAERLALDPWATEVVLSVLQAHGLITRAGAQLALAPAVKAELRGPGGHPTRDTELWSLASRFLKHGTTLAPRATDVRDAVYRDVVVRLAALFEAPAARLAAVLGPVVPACSTVLDVGAGSGVWSLALAHARPDLQVLGLDLPETAARFVERAAGLGLADRARALPGDFNTTTAPAASCGAVVFANVLHLEPPESARALLRAHAPALVPGGVIVIVDALPEADRAESFVSAYGLHLALRQPGARPHAAHTFRAWLDALGFSHIEHHILDDTGLIGALIARA